MKTAFHIRENTLETMGPANNVSPIVAVAEVDSSATAAVENDLLIFFAQFFKRCFHIKIEVLGKRRQHVEVVNIPAIPASYCALGQGEVSVGHDQIWIKKLSRAKSITAGTGSCRVVEGEHSRLKFRNAVAASGAGKSRGKDEGVIVF